MTDAEEIAALRAALFDALAALSYTHGQGMLPASIDFVTLERRSQDLLSITIVPAPAQPAPELPLEIGRAHV